MRGYQYRHFIYFALMENGSIKIGCSTQVLKRMKQIKGELIHVIEGTTFRESALHFLLRESSLGNEMFADDKNVRGFIAKSKFGEYSGLISDVPRVQLLLQPDMVRHKANAVRPFKVMRQSIGLSFDDVANGAEVSKSSAISADSQTAPFFLSGRLAQFMISKVRARGRYVDSHHLTGLYTKELTAMLPRPKVMSSDGIQHSERATNGAAA